VVFEPPSNAAQMGRWVGVMRASGRRAKASVYEVLPRLSATAKGTGNYGYHSPNPFGRTHSRHPVTGPKSGCANKASFGYPPGGKESLERLESGLM
jgi:hypothetical protein